MTPRTGACSRAPGAASTPASPIASSRRPARAPIGVVARHRAAAGDAERAVPLLVGAAEEAAAVGAFAEAASFWTAAADLRAPGPESDGYRQRARAALEAVPAGTSTSIAPTPFALILPVEAVGRDGRRATRRSSGRAVPTHGVRLRGARGEDRLAVLRVGGGRGPSAALRPARPCRAPRRRSGGRALGSSSAAETSVASTMNTSAPRDASTSASFGPVSPDTTISRPARSRIAQPQAGT